MTSATETVNVAKRKKEVNEKCVVQKKQELRKKKCRHKMRHINGLLGRKVAVGEAGPCTGRDRCAIRSLRRFRIIY